MTDRPRDPAAAGSPPVSQPAWTPFQHAVIPPMSAGTAAQLAAASKLPLEQVLAEDARMRREELVRINSRYQVNVRQLPAHDGSAPMIHLSVKRLDKAAIHSWSDLQRIKDELAGPEFEAVEIYPAESRLLDTANQYHLWVLPQHARLPFGLDRAAGACSETVRAIRHYRVRIRAHAEPGAPPLLQLAVARLVQPARHDWRELQQLKNELAGPEREAVELYPARSRLVDSEETHLWVMPEGVRIGFGFKSRSVLAQGAGGAVQRAFGSSPT